MANRDKQIVTETNAFSEISTVEGLIKYLDNDAERLKNRDFLYHYTTLKRVIEIYAGKRWHLANAKYMNDMVEFQNGDKGRWENIFFASFMTDVKESIGMWSMYAQPWRDGVLLSIPKEKARKWIKNVKEFHEISTSSHQPTGKRIAIDNKNTVFLSSVAYTNCENSKDNPKITWSTASNTNIRNASHIPELTGYIKDSAWDYEREIRIKAHLKEGHGFERIAIDVPDEVLNSMTITAGPLFEGMLENRLHKEIQRKFQTSESLFYKKLEIINPCDQCSLKDE